MILPLVGLILASCSSLPNPASVASEAASAPARAAAKALLTASANAHGNRWQRHGRVEVAYDGEWTPLAKRLQPVLTDPTFRQRSIETYTPRAGKVLQIHQGPAGTKEVRRAPGTITVRHNGGATDDPEQLDASALVADAYTAFLFGPSWLLEHATDLRAAGTRELEGSTCDLVGGALRPGFGRSQGDQFILWIERETQLARRLQFTLNGMASTQGADVDVVFSKMVTVADGSIWPTHFLECIQRPILAKAHEWRMVRLELDGRNVIGP